MKTLTALIVALLLIPATAAAQIAPEIRWADPTHVVLDVEFPGDGYHANWELFRCDCGDQLRMALKMISNEGRGALVYLPQEGRGIGLAQKIRAYALQDNGLDTVEANHALGFKADMRDYGIGLQILKDLGLSDIRLLTNNPKKTEAFNLRGFDLRVVDQVPIVGPIHEHNKRYMDTKRDRMGHELP